jgi:hypothetical protein
MNSKTICVALVLIASISTLGQGVKKDSGGPSAEQALRAARPGLAWHHEHSIDLDCDGKRDEVFTAKDAAQYYVAAVVARKGGKPKINVLQFKLSGSTQDSFCGSPEPLQTESMDYDPVEDLGSTPEGYRRSARCQGLYLSAGECDPFHLYWNYKTGELGWWRL